MSDDLEDLAIAVGVLQPPPRSLPTAGEWVAGAGMAALAALAVVSGTAVADFLT